MARRPAAFTARPARWRRRAALFLAAVGVLYGVGTLGQVWWASRLDERAPVDAAVVLGAAQYDGRPSPALQARLDHAGRLHRDGAARVIVLTGGGQAGDRTTEAMSGYVYLRREWQVPEADLLLEVEGRNTWEQLLAAELVLRNHGLGRAVLVSERSHNLRLQEIADRLGLDAAVSPAPPPLRVRALLREAAAVGLGRIVGYRRVGRL